MSPKLIQQSFPARGGTQMLPGKATRHDRLCLRVSKVPFSPDSLHQSAVPGNHITIGISFQLRAQKRAPHKTRTSLDLPPPPPPSQPRARATSLASPHYSQQPTPTHDPSRMKQQYILSCIHDRCVVPRHYRSNHYHNTTMYFFLYEINISI